MQQRIHLGRRDGSHVDTAGRYGAYPVDYDDEEEEALLGDERAPCDEDVFPSDEDCDALAADIDEFEGVVVDVDPDEISQE
eukprot:3068262-Pyramimonas_sp.AAC.1